MAAAPPPCASRRSFRDSPKVLMAAAARAVARALGRAATQFVQTRLRSSGGKVLGEEEKAAENVYIKVCRLVYCNILICIRASDGSKNGPRLGRTGHAPDMLRSL
ncbi:hypothetical protein D1007_52996 [Hordeum vulgare]|nr:hypothetical protein D1007_52996 [Hordeum vulgare]